MWDQWRGSSEEKHPARHLAERDIQPGRPPGPANKSDASSSTCTARPGSPEREPANAASAPSGTLCASQARPTHDKVKSGMSVRQAFPLSPSPEGDHTRTPMMKVHVLPPPPAPAPPRRHACRCIRERNGASIGTGFGGGDERVVKVLMLLRRVCSFGINRCPGGPVPPSGSLPGAASEVVIPAC